MIKVHGFPLEFFFIAIKTYYLCIKNGVFRENTCLFIWCSTFSEPKKKIRPHRDRTLLFQFCLFSLGWLDQPDGAAR